MFIDQSVTPIAFYKGRFEATSYLPLYRKFPELSLSVSMSFALLSINFIHVGDCWKKKGFEHNKLAIFELKLKWVPQTLCNGSTWECVLLHEVLHEEMNIVY